MISVSISQPILANSLNDDSDVKHASVFCGVVL